MIIWIGNPLRTQPNLIDITYLHVGGFAGEFSPDCEFYIGF